MSNKAVFLDRDGTINVEKNYLYKIEDFEYITGVPDALKILSDLGYLLVIITNQSGIARGYYTEEDYLRLNDWMIKDLKKRGIKIAGSYYCPHHPEAAVSKYRKLCDCRKPGIAMFEKAIREFDIDPEKSYAIGDKERDLEICKTTAIRGFLIGVENAGNNLGRNIFTESGGIPEVVNRIVNLDYGKVD